MDEYPVPYILKQLEATNSRNDKEYILRRNSSNEELQRVLQLALNPLILFYIKKIPAYKKTATRAYYPLISALSDLSELSSRRVTGNAAIEYLANLLSKLEKEDADVIERIILKDLRCGVQESTVNKVWPKMIPSWPCMLASGYDAKLVAKMQFPAIAQTKMDGMRFNAVVENDNVEFMSRNGKEIQIKNDLFSQAFIKMAKNIGMNRVIFDGELLVVDSSGKPLPRKEGNGILNKANKGTISVEESAQVRACVWDVIPYNAFHNGKCPVDYETRLVTVVTAVDNLGSDLNYLVHVVTTSIVNNEYEAKKAFEKLYSEGQEGIILKNPKGIWEDKRAKHQIKFKGEEEADLLCIGWEPGTGKYKGLIGSLILQSADKKVNVSTGSGLTDADRKLDPKEYVNKIISIKYNALIENSEGEKSLFLPIFVEVRNDKSKADSLKDLK